MTKDEVWEVLKELGATNRGLYKRKIELYSKYLDSKKAIVEFEDFITRKV